MSAAAGRSAAVACSAAPDPADDPGSAHAPVPDPFDDAHALAELEHEITTLAAHIAAATHRLLALIADFDRRRGWELGGHRSCAHWLHAATAVDLGTAREKVRVARVLVELPRTSEAMARGELAFSQVRALTRVATPACEEELLEVARHSTTAELERFVRAWRTLSRADEAALERERWRSRRLSVFPDEKGMYEVRGTVPAEVGAVLMRAIEAAADALFRDGSAKGARDEVTPKQRRADALGLVAERALAAGFGAGTSAGPAKASVAGSGAEAEYGSEGGSGPEGAEDVSAETSGRADGEAGGAEPDRTPPVPVSGSRAERYQVMLHVEAAAALPRSHLEDGTRVSAETSRRLSCDVRRGRGGGDPGPGRRGAGRGPPDADDPAGAAPGAGGAGPGVPLPGLRAALHRWASHRALGGRGRDEPRQPDPPLPPSPPTGARGGLGGAPGRTGPEEGAALREPQGRVSRPGAGRRGRDDRSGDRDSGKRWCGPRQGGARDERGRDPRRPPSLSDHPARALLEANRARGVDPDGWSLGPRYTGEPGLSWELEARAREALDEAHFGMGAARAPEREPPYSCPRTGRGG